MDNSCLYSEGLPKGETFYYTLALKSMTNCFLPPPNPPVPPSLKHGPFLDCRFFFVQRQRGRQRVRDWGREGTREGGTLKAREAAAAAAAVQSEHLQAAGLDVFLWEDSSHSSPWREDGQQASSWVISACTSYESLWEKVLSLPPHSEHSLGCVWESQPQTQLLQATLPLVKAPKLFLTHTKKVPQRIV